MKGIRLTQAEVQSGMNRLRMAEGLITQLPEHHEGRNAWLMNYGTSAESVRLRKTYNLCFDAQTQAAKRVGK